MKRIGAVILAAGESRRQGRNKLLLPFRDTTVIQQAVTAFTTLHIPEIVLVTGHFHEDIVTLGFPPSVRLVRNIHYAEGMTSSVGCGLRAFQQMPEGVLVCPGDMPMILSATLVTMIRTWDRSSICVPVCQGKKGHPVLLPRVAAEWCLDYPGDKVLHAALQTFHVQEVEVEDEGIWKDVDNPEDYEAMQSGGM